MTIGTGSHTTTPPAPSPSDIEAWRQRIRAETIANHHYEMGVAIEAEGDLPAATQAYRHALELAPDMRPAHYRLVRALRARNAHEEANAAHERALVVDPLYVGAGMVRDAMRLLNGGKEAEALELLRQAVEIAPTLDEARAHYGALLLFQGREHEAEAILADITALDPWSGKELAEILYRRGRTEYGLVAYRRAMGLVRAATRFDPSHASAHEFLAYSLMPMGRVDEAGEAFRRLVEIDPTHLWGRILLARHLLSKDDFATAEPVLRSLMDTHPQDAGVLGTIGLFESARGEVERAETTFRHVLARNANDLIALTGLGIVQRQAGRMGQAKATLRRAVEADPSSSFPWTSLGLALDGLGETAEAERCYRRASKIAHPELLAYEARLLAPPLRAELLRRHHDLGLIPA